MDTIGVCRRTRPAFSWARAKAHGYPGPMHFWPSTWGGRPRYRGGVHLRLLIDGIVRQTTVLLAQISTSDGSRSPLSHVADQVFFELAKEIEAQGIKRRVAADMFGMALRAYQKKTRRLTESASARDRTLWQAVLELIEQGETTRSRIEKRFER